jgi:hypothetical protein
MLGSRLHWAEMHQARLIAVGGGRAVGGGQAAGGAAPGAAPGAGGAGGEATASAKVQFTWLTQQVDPAVWLTVPIRALELT